MIPILIYTVLLDDVLFSNGFIVKTNYHIFFIFLLLFYSNNIFIPRLKNIYPIRLIHFQTSYKNRVGQSLPGKPNLNPFMPTVPTFAP